MGFFGRRKKKALRTRTDAVHRTQYIHQPYSATDPNSFATGYVVGSLLNDDESRDSERPEPTETPEHDNAPEVEQTEQQDYSYESPTYEPETSTYEAPSYNTPSYESPSYDTPSDSGGYSDTGSY